METDESDPVRQGHAVAVERFNRALESGVGASFRHYIVGGRRVHLRIVGPGLAAVFSSPWEHLAAPESSFEDGDLRIDLWHRAETGIAMPESADEIDPLSRFPYRTSPDDRFLAARQPETHVWLDRQTSHLVGIVDRVDRRALYEVGRPLETPVLIWLRDQGVALVHASFVALGDRGALIVGKSGSGKSTLAAQCACAGFDFLSDDKIAFVRSGGDFIGHSLNSSMHVDASSLKRLPALAGDAIAPTFALDDKFRIPMEHRFPRQLARSAAIRALVLPSLTNEPGGRVERASKRDALLALSLSTLLSLPIAGDRSLGQLGELVDNVPAYVIDLNPEHDVAQRLASVLGL